MNDSEQKIKFTTLEFTRKINEYFRVSDDTKVRLKSYSEGKFIFNVQRINYKTENHECFVGGSFNILDSVSINVVGHSIKTGRVEIRVKAPKDILIDRG